MAMSETAFLQSVVERGEYASESEAAHTARVVLALLGVHLVGPERTRLAALLPAPYARVLRKAPPAEGPVSSEQFVQAVAAWIDGATAATALWDVGAVLSTVADLADEDLLRQLVLQLPTGFELLFGRPQAA